MLNITLLQIQCFIPVVFGKLKSTVVSYIEFQQICYKTANSNKLFPIRKSIISNVLVNSC